MKSRLPASMAASMRSRFSGSRTITLSGSMRLAEAASIQTPFQARSRSEGSTCLV